MSLDDFKRQLRAFPATPDLYFYVLADSAQDPQLPAMFHKTTPHTRSQCLLTHVQGPDLEAAAPHLATLPPFEENDEGIWPLLFSYAPQHPASVSIIASPLQFDALYAHLHQFTDVILPDKDQMIFAFWDPAILGTLVGQKDDATLHLAGPVLTVRQRAKLLEGISAWWYWGRNGGLHQIKGSGNEFAPNDTKLPLRLIEAQVEMLVEASVPDHLLGYIKENKPELLIDVPEQEQYSRVEKHLLEARKLHLFGMRDMLNYICAALIYGDRLRQDGAIEALLAQVKAGQISLTDALEQFP
jgi:hypothetical protein